MALGADPQAAGLPGHPWTLLAHGRVCAGDAMGVPDLRRGAASGSSPSSVEEEGHCPVAASPSRGCSQSRPTALRGTGGNAPPEQCDLCGASVHTRLPGRCPTPPPRAISQTARGVHLKVSAAAGSQPEWGLMLAPLLDSPGPGQARAPFHENLELSAKPTGQTLSFRIKAGSLDTSSTELLATGTLGLSLTS